MWNVILMLYVFISYITMQAINLSDVNLPPEHLTYFFNKFPSVAEICLSDEKCSYRGSIGRKSCWGYEPDCEEFYSYHVRPRCPGDHRGWVKSKEAQYDTFYTQADFGFVKEQLNELMVMCEASFPDDSSLECSKYLRFCRGRNLMLNFTSLLGRGDSLRYKMDILDPGQIGGYCKFYSQRLKNELDHMSALQSWAPEMRNFVKTNKRPADDLCDITIEKPTFIMKLDANALCRACMRAEETAAHVILECDGVEAYRAKHIGAPRSFPEAFSDVKRLLGFLVELAVNMYHHFCDFFNLYSSLHINSTHPSTFSRDNHILIWETFTYDSAFKDTFKAFTINPIWDLKKFRGKTVCFKNVVFPLLPRMIFGLYYNTPLIYGCERSGLFHAFSKHILHSLNVKLNLRKDDKVRVTLLSRGTTYRSILNEDKIVAALEKVKGYHVQRVMYDRTLPFVKQLEITHNTDVFIGMHGAGLTHLLFLPDWAAVFEVYNCEDPNCYSDLTRLRGLKYVTWEDKTKLIQQDEGRGPGGGSHAKFTNYWFDVDEFLRLVNKCADHVRRRQDFKNFVEASLRSQRTREEL